MISWYRAAASLFAPLRFTFLSLVLCAGYSCGSSGSNSAPPSGLGYSQNPALYALAVEIPENVPSVTGSVTSWQVSPLLPAGLALDPSTGVISGTPTEVQEATVYTIVAGNSAGGTAVDLTLTVAKINPPSGLSYSPANPYRADAPIAPLPPTLTGMITGYALAEDSPSLPIGLTLDPLFGVIAGTPLLRTAETITVTVVASNPAGETSTDVDFEVLARDTRFAYVTNEGADTVSIFGVDSSTGQLTGRGFAPTGDAPRGVAVSPSGDAVYVANFLDGTVSVFQANPTTGALLAQPTVAAGTGTRDLAVGPGGAWCFALNGLSGDVSRYEVDAETGELIPRLPNQSLGGPAQTMAIGREGRFLYVGVAASLSIAVYEINPGTGALSFVQNAPVPMVAADLVIDPSGRFLYVPNGTHNVSAFEIDPEDGTLTAVAGSPWSVGAGTPGPVAAAVSADGTRLYTANSLANNVSQFEIDLETGALTALDPLTTASGTTPWAIAVGAQDGSVFATHAGSRDAYAFAVDEDRLLTSASPAPIVQTGIDPVAIAISLGSAPLTSRSDFVYAANQGSVNVSGYEADSGVSGTGELTPIAGSPFDGGAMPFSVAIHPSNRFLYSAETVPGSLSVFTVDEESGALTAGIGVGAGAHVDVLLDPSGIYAYGVISAGASTVETYTVAQDTGELTPVGSNVAAGSGALLGDVHPTGRFLYVATEGSNEVSAAAIDAANGVLTPIASASAGLGPRAVAVHPTGRWLYAVNNGSNDVSQFTIDALAGVLTPRTPAAVANPTAGGDARDVVVHPTGRFLYVANGVNEEVLLFAIDPETGLLTGVDGTNVGAEARGLIVDASGRFLYVSVGGGGNLVRTFEIDPEDGSFSGAALAAAGTAPRGLAASRNDQ